MLFKQILGVLIICFVLCNCVGYRSQLHKGEGDREQAIRNVIIDFANTYQTPRSYLKERDGKPFNVFVIRKWDTPMDDLFVISVLPWQAEITLQIQDSLGKVPRDFFPNRYLEKNEKLFLWNDGTNPLNKELLAVMDRFEILDSIDVKMELGLLPEDYEDTRMAIIDDKLKGVHYYLCKKNIEKYRKVKTNIALGYYDPPGLNCPD